MDFPTDPSKWNKNLITQFQTLVEVVARLRGPNGCPWDKAQNQKSLTQYAIEEAYELVEAIESGDSEEIKEELGDYLFQAILQAQVAEDEKQFDLESVLETINHKLIERHPHVFSDTQVDGITDVWKNWEQIKKNEAERKGKVKKIFNYPSSLPALQASHKIGVKTESYKFDWETPDQVLAKVDEEYLELKEALRGKKSQEIENELGDFLFSIAQLARHLGFESEQALRQCNRRFEKRFEYMLKHSGLKKEEFSQLDSNQKEELWKVAKKKT